MRIKNFSTMALVATLGSPAIAQAQFVTYTSQASFLAAITNPGVDAFTGFTTTNTTASPITRDAGPYRYTAVVTDNNEFFGVVSLSRSITTFTVSAVQLVDNFLWPTVDNLILAQTTVPEPGTYALLAMGLLAIGLVTRRQRACLNDQASIRTGRAG